LNLHLPVDNRQPDRPVGLPLDDDGIVPRVFQLGGKLTAHVSGPHERLGPAGRPEGGDGHAAVTGGAGPGQGSHREDDPVGRVVRVGPRRHLIPHHLVADPGAAQKILILLYGIFGPGSSGR
jgi:hypothetical protein